MSLAKIYCKEIIKELDKIPVYLPGTPVNPGDIITFGRTRPIGSFSQVSSLLSLGIQLQERTDADPDPYLYSSKGAVGVSFTSDASTGNTGDGKLEITFNREASTYFAAIDCGVTSFVDISTLPQQLEPHRNRIDWKSCFIVTAVTIAKKALIMQANSQNASLTIEGNVKGLQTGADLKINASISVKIDKYKDSSFIKDWSENVTVFFSLATYRKKPSGDWKFTTKRAMFLNQDSDIFELSSIYPHNLLEEDEE
jgi:hypothetical protein